jgi:hypothetical protein
MSGHPVIPVSHMSEPTGTAYYIQDVSSGTCLGLASDNSTMGLFPLKDDTKSNYISYPTVRLPPAEWVTPPFEGYSQHGNPFK